jgi:multidrug efflux system membrane fusion protein
MTVPTAKRHASEPPQSEAELPAASDTARAGALRRRRVWLIVGLVVLGLVILALVRRSQPGTAQTGAAGQARVVPVGVANVEQRDVPIWLEGLGNVTSQATVTIRARVNGQLVAINFQEGSRVKKGDVLVQVDPRPFRIALDQAQATLQKDEANLKYARLDLARYTDLVGQKLVSQQQVDQQRSTVDQLAATVALDQAAVNNARLNLQFTSVTSPIDGLAGVRQVDIGNLVTSTDANGIVTLTQMDPIAVIFTLPQDDLPRVGEAFAKGPLTVEAWDRGGLAKLGIGQLKVIDNQINAATATLRLKAEFSNPDLRLWPSQFVKARLLLETRSGATVAATPAVQRGPNGTFVYVVNPDNTVAVRPVQVDTFQGPLALIAQGLKPGERVVTDGQNQLRPGAKVDPRPVGGPSVPGQQPAAQAQQQGSVPVQQPGAQQPGPRQPAQQPGAQQPGPRQPAQQQRGTKEARAP